jgi:hypothetical protein
MARNRPLILIRPDVSFGSIADICSAKWHVRFTPNSGHVQCTSSCLLCARSERGILFVSAAYCDANVWRYFLFGAIFVRLRRERQALLRAREPPLDQKIEDQTEHRLEKMAATFSKSARKSWTMKCAGSSQNFTMP